MFFFPQVSWSYFKAYAKSPWKRSTGWSQKAQIHILPCCSLVMRTWATPWTSPWASVSSTVRWDHITSLPTSQTWKGCLSLAEAWPCSLQTFISVGCPYVHGNAFHNCCLCKMWPLSIIPPCDRRWLALSTGTPGPRLLAQRGTLQGPHACPQPQTCRFVSIANPNLLQQSS